MVIKCKNCNTFNNYRKYGEERTENTIIEIYKCACGRVVARVFWNKSLITNRQDGKIINSKKF